MQETNAPTDIKSEYLESLIRCCVAFRLDGMPEAGELFYREISLEDIYFPLRLSPTQETVDKLDRQDRMWEEEYKQQKSKAPNSPVDQEQLQRIDEKLNVLEKEETSFQTREQIDKNFLSLVELIDLQMAKTHRKAVQIEKVDALLSLLDENIAKVDSNNENLLPPEIDSPAELQNAAAMMIAQLEQRPNEYPHSVNSPPVDIDETFKNQQLALYDEKPVGPLLSNEPSRRVVLSDPGYGKTTLSKRVALAYANDEQDFKAEIGLPGDLFPVLLMCNWLNSIAIEPDQPFLDILVSMSQQQFAECLGSKDASIRFIQAILQEARKGTLLLIVDGFDEIFDEQKQNAFAASLSGFLMEQRNTHLLLTSRVATFANRANAAGGVSRIQSIPHIRYNMIPRLSREEVANFCRRWYSVLFPNDPGKVGDAERIIEQLSSPSFEYLSGMASAPLHLSTILLTTRVSGVIPNNKKELYERYLLTALNWHSKGTIDAHDTLIQLAYVAAYMMKEGIQRISRNMLEETLRRCYSDLEGSFIHPMLDANVGPFIEELEERTCVLQKSFMFSSESIYQFTHLQLQEYLAAHAFVFGCSDPEDYATPLAEILGSHFRQTAWREVIVLALMMRNDRDNSPVIQRLIDEAKGTEENYYATNLLFEMITNCVPVARDLKKQIYDLLFKEHITDLQIRKICDFMNDERSGGFAQYIFDKFAASLEEGSNDYGFAMAAISAYRMVGMDADPLAKAQEMVLEQNDVTVATGLSIFTVLGWCKYCEIKNAFSNYDITISHALTSRLHDILIAPESRVWDSAALAVQDMLLAEYADAAALLDENVFAAVLGAMEEEKKRRPADRIVSMFPINYQTLLYDKTAVPPSLRELYLTKYRDEFRDPEKADTLVFTFAICTLLGCWDTAGEALMEEFTDLEGYYSINKKKADDAAEKRLAQLQKQIYSLADPVSAGYQFYADRDYVNARAAFLTALSRGDITVKNNLAYMLRRGEIPDVKYEGVEYTVPMLLEKGIAEKEPFSLVNYALHKTFSGCPIAYDAGLSIVREIDLGDTDVLNRVYAWWLKVAKAGEAEGFIVLLWLMEIGAVSATPFGTAPEIKSLLNNQHHIIV